MEVPQRIEVADGGTVLRLAWEDGASAELSARTLRSACPCASCGEPAGRAALTRLLGADEPVRITGAELVGTYAVSFAFAPDGHGTGIYPFERLRALTGAYDEASPPGGP
ncbi:MAG: DUF971 domain-containing protein [Acidimicrobiia bacterium]|nr:DUF971 domain-containing protein [Acidimicrobiia bacterium]